MLLSAASVYPERHVTVEMGVPEVKHLRSIRATILDFSILNGSTAAEIGVFQSESPRHIGASIIDLSTSK